MMNIDISLYYSRQYQLLFLIKSLDKYSISFLQFYLIKLNYLVSLIILLQHIYFQKSKLDPISSRTFNLRISLYNTFAISIFFTTNITLIFFINDSLLILFFEQPINYINLFYTIIIKITCI